MKKLILFFMIVLASWQLKSQSRFKVLCEDSTLQVSNGDTSYIFNVYVLTVQPGGISSVTLACQHLNDSLWVPASDTVYSWSAVTASAPGTHTAYSICRVNASLLKICLGRLYYPQRRRFVLTASGSNGTVIKDFIF